MIAAVDAVHGTIGPNFDAVSALEGPALPRAQEIAVAIEDQHRVLSARMDIDIVVRICCERTDSAKFHSVGDLCPVLNYLVLVRTLAIQHRCSFLSALKDCHARGSPHQLRMS